MKEKLSKVNTFNYGNEEYNILLDKEYVESYSNSYVNTIANLVKKDFMKKENQKLLVSDCVINTEMDGKSAVIIYSLEENHLIVSFVTNDTRLIL